MTIRYYKVTENGQLVLIGIGEGGEEITREEYDALLEEIRSAAMSEELAEGVETDGSV